MSLKNLKERREYMREWKERNREKVNATNRESYARNIEKERARNKRYREQNSEKVRARLAIYRAANKEKLKVESRERYREDVIRQRTRGRRRWETNKESMMAYRKLNRLKFREYYRLYNRRRNASDIQFKLAARLRARIYAALKGETKSKKTLDLLGCSVEYFVYHLESKFTDGMTWEKIPLWHIDHIKPISSFDLTDPEQLAQACHYTNLQPLWASENIRKGNRLDYKSDV